MTNKWSHYQEDIFTVAPDKDSGNLVVVARAGTGKTTTGVEAVNRLLRGFPVTDNFTVPTVNMHSSTDTTPSVVFLAFNKSIAMELSKRLPTSVVSSTFHSLGLNAVKNYLRGYVKVDGGKVNKILTAMVQSNELERWESEVIGGPALRLVNLARDMGIGVLQSDTHENWYNIIRHFDIDIETDMEIQGKDATEACIDLSRTILDRCNKQSQKDRIVDFGDMLYLCVKWPVPMTQFDYVLVDEAQDTNPIQRAIIKKILKTDGKLIAVGDDMQAIYGFRGADSDALDLIKEEFNAKTLPLNISYRCSKAVIRYVQQWVPDIEYHEDAIEGYVGSVPEGWTYKEFTKEDVILCRNTAPLISMAYRLINKKVACKVLGREIGQGLVALIKRLKPQGIKGLIEKIATYREREVTSLMSKGQEDKAQAIDDKCDSIMAAIESLPVDATVPQLIDHIQSLFNNQDENILTLCTIHKSKGLEFENVYQLDSHLCPSKFARQAWQYEQEIHLLYVQGTRAMNSIFFINSKGINWDVQ